MARSLTSMGLLGNRVDDFGAEQRSGSKGPRLMWFVCFKRYVLLVLLFPSLLKGAAPPAVSVDL